MNEVTTPEEVRSLKLDADEEKLAKAGRAGAAAGEKLRDALPSTSADEATATLLPCPFCGTWERDDEQERCLDTWLQVKVRAGYAMVECFGCGTESGFHKQDEASAIAAWNCRADTVATRACRAALAYDIEATTAPGDGFSATDISNAMGFSEPVGETTNAALERTIKEEWQARVLPWARRQLAEDEKRILEGEPGSGEPVGFLTRPAPAAEGRSDRNIGAMCGTCVSLLIPVSEGYPCDGCGSEGDDPGFD